MAKKTTKKSSPTPAKPLTKKPSKTTVKASAKPSSRPVAKKPPRVAMKAKLKPQPKIQAKPKLKRAAVAETVVETKPSKPLTAKPGRNQAGLNAKDLERFRELLILKRRELLGDVNSMEDEALRNSGGSNLSNLPIHMADMGTDNYEQEFTLGLVEKDRRILREIHNAISKMQDGTYGICEGTGKPISKARLEAQPWTRYSIEHARKLEQQRVRR